jgi:hypothetical protein
MKTFDPMFDQAVAKTERALATFQHAMNQVDADLRRIVSQRPELLDEAEDLQAMRGFDFSRAELAPSEQPVVERRQNDPATLSDDERAELERLEQLAQVEERRVDTPHPPTEAEGADLGRPADAGDVTSASAAHTAGTNHADQGPDWAKS